MSLPFSAVLGQEEMKLALLLCAVDPAIGGVLLTGTRGSAKSSTARALAALLPEIQVHASCALRCDPGQPCGSCDGGAMRSEPTPFVELPLGATDDRVVGTLDLSRALRSGETRLEPGLLARAHRGVLYVDEVNLLPDHLVDLLLDVAASGWNQVERDGVSVRHPARFVLIGTMNPDEGELRPQLLDRFGLTARIGDLHEPAQRAEATRRALTYARDPESFARVWTEHESRLREQLADARERLRKIEVPATIAAHVAELCLRENVEGLRADLAVLRAAIALAAWESRGEVELQDVERVAELALAHRRQVRAPEPPPQQPRPPQPPTPPPPRSTQRNESSSADVVTPSRPLRVQLPHDLQTPPDRTPRSQRTGRGASRATPRSASRRASGPALESLDLARTLRAAARRCTADTWQVTAEDLHVRRRPLAPRRLYVFVLDASRSMGVQQRMAQTKGALLGLLRDARRGRESVSLVSCRGDQARLLLPPTSSVRRAERCVAELAIGGRTPLASGLAEAGRIATLARKSERVEACVVLVSDGRPTSGGADPKTATEQELERLHRSGFALCFVDTECTLPRLGHMPAWAACFDAPLLSLDTLTSHELRRASA